VANVPRAKDVSRSSSSKKSPKPAPNKEPSVYNFKPLEGSHASVLDRHFFLKDIPPDISDQITTEIAYSQNEPVKLGKLPLPS
jgi:hypothetical protein